MCHKPKGSSYYECERTVQASERPKLHEKKTGSTAELCERVHSRCVHLCVHARITVGFVLLRCVAVSARGGDTHADTSRLLTT